MRGVSLATTFAAIGLSAQRLLAVRAEIRDAEVVRGERGAAEERDLWEQRMKVHACEWRTPTIGPFPEGVTVALEVQGQGAGARRVGRGVQCARAGRGRVRHEHDRQLAGALIRLLGKGGEVVSQLEYRRVTGKISLSEGMLRSIPFEDKGTFN